MTTTIESTDDSPYGTGVLDVVNIHEVPFSLGCRGVRQEVRSSFASQGGGPRIPTTHATPLETRPLPCRLGSSDARFWPVPFFSLRGCPVPRRRCLDAGSPGCATYTDSGSRCDTCRRRRKAARNADRTVAAEAVTAWRATHGDWCPGWRRPGHSATDLTAEHGPNPVGSRRVHTILCRSCNSRKGARP